MPLSSLKSGGGGRSKSFPVKVTTVDAELEFDVEAGFTGKDLFDLVCRTLGLREVWYFGLQFCNTKGEATWLKLVKKILDQDLARESPVPLSLLAKFYPENVEEDLVQEVTQHLLYGQVKQSIISMDVYCPPEAAVLLASYAVQATLGDFDEPTFDANLLVMDDLLPQRVIDQFNYSSDDWAEEIKKWYSEQEGLTRDEAEMEYLKLAQSLDMYGINYFPIKCSYNLNQSLAANETSSRSLSDLKSLAKKTRDMWLGVKATGLNIYEHDRLRPEQTLSWAEIKDVQFRDKKFTITLKDKKPNFVFYSLDLQVNKQILELCIGNHDLFVKRRQADPLEIQQMKIQAKEEKQRKKIERERFQKTVRVHYEKQLTEAREEIQALQEVTRTQEQAADLLEEKVQVLEEENKLLVQKSSQLESEAKQLQLLLDGVEEEKRNFQERAKTAELNSVRLVEACEARIMENKRLEHELQGTQMLLQERVLKTGTGPPSPYSNDLGTDLVYPNYLTVQNEADLMPNVHDSQISLSLREPEQYYSNNISPGASQNQIQFSYIAQNGGGYAPQQNNLVYGQQTPPQFAQLNPAEPNFQPNMYSIGYNPSGYPDNPSGYPDNPTRYADSSSGYADNPSGYADTPTGYPDNPTGYAVEVEYPGDARGSVETREVSNMTEDVAAMHAMSREDFSKKMKAFQESRKELSSGSEESRDKLHEERQSGSHERLNSLGKVPGPSGGVVAFFEEL